jgi:predicted TIM-barrel fold metal-dependent hydrolase
MPPPNVPLGPAPCFARRRLLQFAGISLAGFAVRGLAGSLPAAHSAQTEAPKDGWIDAHVHVWTPDTQRYPLATCYTREQMNPPSFTPEELLSHARPCGVTRIVLIQMSFYGFDNSYMLDTIRGYPGTFSGVAVIDEAAPGAQDEMRRLKQLGVRGFRIAPRNRPAATWLDSDHFDSMWKCGAEERLAMCHLINPDSLPAVDRMCAKHPDTPVVIDHFARIGIDGEIRESDLAALCKLARHHHVAVKISAFYALGKKAPPYSDLAPMIRRLLDALGPERLMWATDCPFQVQPGHTYSQSIELVRDRLDFLSEGDRQWLLKKTAERVFL